MNRSLHFLFLAASLILLNSLQYLHCQSVLFSEDFSGFTTGTHSTPSTYDQSGSLDTKTGDPGWSGYKVYSAGGEIKLGTASIPGWIETPSIDLSGLEGTAFLSFDISRWPDDATTVQVYLNGSTLGDPIEPADEFQTIELSLADAGLTCIIKFESLSKRFYLDNIQITDNIVTHITNYNKPQNYVKIFPNPACSFICIENLNGYNNLDIIDINGRILKSYNFDDRNNFEIALSGIPSGIYIIRIKAPHSIFTSRIIKYE